MISGADVSAAARQTWQTYLPTQLAALTRPLPEPGTYAEIPTPDLIRRVKGSALAVSAASLVGPPERQEDGTWDGRWSVVASLLHENRPETPLFTATDDYGIALAATLLQHPDLGGLAREVIWTDLSVDVMGDSVSTGLLGIVTVEFEVVVDGLVDENDQPNDQPDVLATSAVAELTQDL